MTDYTSRGISSPSGSDQVAVHSDIRATAITTDAAISQVEAAALKITTLSTSSPLDALKDTGVNQVPSQTVGTAIGFPYPGLGAATVTDSGYSGTNKLAQQYAWDYSKSTFKTRTSQTSGGWTPWEEFRPGDAAVQRREVAVAAFLSRRGGRIGTGGRAAVALRFDHHTQDFAAKVLPLLKQYRLPWSLNLNPSNVGTGDDTMTYAQMQAEAIASGGEVWNHGGNHNDQTSDYLIKSQIVGALTTLRTSLPRLPIEGWHMPGVGGTGYNGLNGGATEDEWSTYAGSLVTQYHAACSGSAGGIYRSLDGVLKVGEAHYTMDKQDGNTVKAVINGAVAAGAGLCLMLHASEIGQSGSITPTQLDIVLAYIAQLRDAGTLVPLTNSGLLIADADLDERHNLLPGATMTSAWSGWTISGGIATGSTTPMTTTLPLSRQIHMCGGTRELVVYARASVARTLTITTTDTQGTVATTHPVAGTGAWVRVSRPYTIPLDDTAPTISITSSGTTDVARVDALAI